MICNVCGQKIEEGQMFCPKCGAKVETTSTDSSTTTTWQQPVENFLQQFKKFIQSA